MIHPSVANLLPLNLEEAKDVIAKHTMRTVAYRRAKKLAGEQFENALHTGLSLLGVIGKPTEKDIDSAIQKIFSPNRENCLRAARVIGLLVEPNDFPGYYWGTYEAEISECMEMLREHFHQLPQMEWEHRTGTTPWWTLYRAAQQDRDWAKTHFPDAVA